MPEPSDRLRRFAKHYKTTDDIIFRDTVVINRRKILALIREVQAWRELDDHQITGDPNLPRKARAETDAALAEAESDR